MEGKASVLPLPLQPEQEAPKGYARAFSTRGPCPDTSIRFPWYCEKSFMGLWERITWSGSTCRDSQERGEQRKTRSWRRIMGDRWQLLSTRKKKKCPEKERGKKPFAQCLESIHRGVGTTSLIWLLPHKTSKQKMPLVRGHDVHQSCPAQLPFWKAHGLYACSLSLL